MVRRRQFFITTEKSCNTGGQQPSRGNLETPTVSHHIPFIHGAFLFIVLTQPIIFLTKLWSGWISTNNLSRLWLKAALPKQGVRTSCLDGQIVYRTCNMGFPMLILVLGSNHFMHTYTQQVSESSSIVMGHYRVPTPWAKWISSEAEKSLNIWPLTSKFCKVDSRCPLPPLQHTKSYPISQILRFSPVWFSVNDMYTCICIPHMASGVRLNSR